MSNYEKRLYQHNLHTLADLIGSCDGVYSAAFGVAIGVAIGVALGLARSCTALHSAEVRWGWANDA